MTLYFKFHVCLIIFGHSVQYHTGQRMHVLAHYLKWSVQPQHSTQPSGYQTRAVEQRAYANQSTQYCTVTTSDTLLFIVLSSLDILIYFYTLPFHFSRQQVENKARPDTRAGWKQLRGRPVVF
jgi:hypothetical protein